MTKNLWFDRRWNQPKVSLSTVYKAEKFFFFFYRKRTFLRKRGSGGLNKKQKEGFLTALVTAIKKDPTTLIRKHANELKVHKKETVKTTIKQDLSPDLISPDYIIWGVLENKTNATSHPRIRSLKTARKEEWNKHVWRIYFEGMQIVLIACWYNNCKKMVAILSKFTVLCLSCFF